MKAVVIAIYFALIFSSQLTAIHSYCTEFEKQWEPCPPELHPDIDSALCIHKSNTSEKVVVIEGKQKTSAVYCSNDAFPNNAFDCLPFTNTKHFILSDCPFPQDNFDKFFSNSHLNDLTVQYPNSRILQTSLHLNNLPNLQYFSLKGFHSYSHFDLVFNSVPLIKSIKISNSTFTSLPGEQFQNVSELKRLSLTEGILEELPDDFLIGTNLQVLDFDFNRLKNFQPSLLRNMKTLRSLNLSHNLLETIDKDLLRDTTGLQVVIFDNNRINSLPEELFKSTTGLRFLSIKHNELKDIPNNIFQGLNRLKALHLNNNYLSVLPSDVFHGLSSLMVVRLEYNKLHSLSEKLFSSQRSLYRINLSNNKLSAFSSSSPFGTNRHLAIVNISGNGFEQFLNLNWSLYNISQLDLSDNSITEVTIPATSFIPNDSANYERLIFLQRNLIQRVTVMKNVPLGYRYYLEGNPLDCCYNFNDFLSILPIIADAKSLVCKEPRYRNGLYVEDIKHNENPCQMEDDCPSNCKCRLLGKYQFEVNCGNTEMKSAAISLPIGTTVLHFENNQISSLSHLDENAWMNITRLYLSNNSLTSLQGWKIPPKLQLLAIDGNNLTKLPPSLMERINGLDDFKIYMKDNDWRCDCQIIPLQMWLVNNSFKVKDAFNTYCKEYNKDASPSLIVNVSLDDYDCPETQHLNQSAPIDSAKTGIRANLSISFYLMLYIANKICF